MDTALLNHFECLKKQERCALLLNLAGSVKHLPDSCFRFLL
jgi:hypothetical protein